MPKTMLELAGRISLFRERAHSAVLYNFFSANSLASCKSGAGTRDDIGRAFPINPVPIKLNRKRSTATARSEEYFLPSVNHRSLGTRPNKIIPHNKKPAAFQIQRF